MQPRGERPSAGPLGHPGHKLRSRRRPRLRFDFGRALFVLPNLFTISSIFCGFYAILQVGASASPAALHRASVAICFAIFFDMADGRVARLTATESSFGVQLDSLADIVSFGVAPAVLAHAWALGRLGPLGPFLGFVYIACGAIRLARFNVMAAHAHGVAEVRVTAPLAHPRARAVSYFLGLPIPLAAGQLATAIMCAQRYYLPWRVERIVAPLLVALLAALMVSNVRFRTFKDVALSGPTVALGCGIMAVFLLVAKTLSPALGGLGLFASYVALGLVQHGWWTIEQAAARRRQGGQ